jgi:hypothetical protein
VHALPSTTAQIDSATKKYQRLHQRKLGRHQSVMVNYARAGKFNPVIDLIVAGAARDPKVADRFFDVGTRNRSPLSLFSPLVLARAALAARSRPSG